MNATEPIRRLLRCAFDADARVLDWMEAAGVYDEALLGWQSHILHAQNRWGRRIAGIPENADLFAILDIPAMRVLHAEAPPRLKQGLKGDLKRTFSFTRNGMEYSMTVEDALLQVATHGHHHHGQMATRARLVGLSDFPDTSFIGWMRSAQAENIP